MSSYVSNKLTDEYVWSRQLKYKQMVYGYGFCISTKGIYTAFAWWSFCLKDSYDLSLHLELTIFPLEFFR